MKYIIKLLIPLKNYIWATLCIIGGFLIPLSPLITVTTCLAIFDWVVKIYCVYTVSGKEGIKSNKMQDTFFKIVLYGLFLLTLFIVDNLFIKHAFFNIFDVILKGLLEDEFATRLATWITSVQLAAIGTLMILIREGKSVDENWEMAFGYSPLGKIYNVIKPLIRWKD